MCRGDYREITSAFRLYKARKRTIEVDIVPEGTGLCVHVCIHVFEVLTICGDRWSRKISVCSRGVSVL